MFIIGARTPASKGIRCQALSAISSMKLAMSLTEKMDWETKEYFDVVCPHGFVTYRLSRISEGELNHQVKTALKVLPVFIILQMPPKKADINLPAGTPCNM